MHCVEFAVRFFHIDSLEEGGKNSVDSIRSKIPCFFYYELTTKCIECLKSTIKKRESIQNQIEKKIPTQHSLIAHANKHQAKEKEKSDRSLNQISECGNFSLNSFVRMLFVSGIETYLEDLVTVFLFVFIFIFFAFWFLRFCLAVRIDLIFQQIL